jgi:hypothetical protein
VITLRIDSMRRGGGAAALLLAGALALPALAADSAAPTDVSVAEQRLFVDNHFKDVRGKVGLDYVFEKRGTLEAPVDDSAHVEVGRPEADGARSVQVDYLHGPHQVKLPSPGRVEGNPVILFFLEREVREMKRRTGGSELYFRKRMRMALANAAEVKPVKRKVGGREVDALEIRIAPFRDDPMRSRYDALADKTYLLTLSEAVPGQVIELSTELTRSAAGGSSEMVLSETLRFKGTH